MKQVEGGFILFDQLAQQVHQELVIGGGKAGDKLVFVGTAGTLQGISALAMWRCKLKFDVFFLHEFMENFSFLIF